MICPECGHDASIHLRDARTTAEPQSCIEITATAQADDGHWYIASVCGCSLTQVAIRRALDPPRRLPRPAIPIAVKRAVIERDGMICQLCRCRVYVGGRAKRWPRRKLNLDHIEPYHLGGDHTVENLRVTCQRCNCSRMDYSRTTTRQESSA